jgi:hypothetical protein
MRSWTLRAIGVITGLQIGEFIVGEDIPIEEIRLQVGLNATTPQHAAG